MTSKNFENIINKLNTMGIELLDNSNLLENTIKELYISQLISDIKIDQKKFKLFYKNFSNTNKIKNETQLTQFLNANSFNKEIFEKKLKRSFKIQEYFLDKFRSKAKEFFLENKNIFDKVTYSLIRTKDFKFSKEIYLQIEANEKTIYDLAEKYSLGDERFTKGVIGPIPLNQSHEIIKEKINNLKIQEISEPFKVDNWWIILKLEKIIRTNFSPQIESKICRDFFEQNVLRTSKSIINQVRNINGESN